MHLGFAGHQVGGKKATKEKKKFGSVNRITSTYSVRHSPHFDWVVAHIGGCFPDTVINRVLNVGLKEFCQSAESQVCWSNT